MKKLFLLILTFCMVASYCVAFATENSSEKMSNISDKNTTSVITNYILDKNKNKEKTTEKKEDLVVAIEKAELYVGEEVYITADKDVEFSSSDTSVIQVDKEGKVTAIGEGVADVIITHDTTSEKIEIIVKTIPDFEVKMPDFLEIGKTEQIIIETEQNFIAEYSSSNPEIIEVNENGNITVLKKEKASVEITLTFEDGLTAIQIIEIEPSNIIEANAEQFHGLCVIIIAFLIVITPVSNILIYYYVKKAQEETEEPEEKEEI